MNFPGGVYDANAVSAFSESVFIKIGLPAAKARLASQVLLLADLRGINSHGIARLAGYVRLWQKGRINTTADSVVAHETLSTATLDGNAGLGLVIGQEAMRLAIDKAMVCGTGWVAVRNSSHFGIAASHAMLALDHDMIGIAMTNASPLVAPTFSNERMLGTNPMCFAIPAGKESPFVADLATSAAANGKLELASYEKRQVPAGWVQNEAGDFLTDPQALKNGGSLLPLGSDPEHGSHKGYALAATVDILSAVLSGANYGPWVPPFVAFLEPAANPVGKGIGHFFGAMRIDAFRPGFEFKAHMDNWIKTFKEARTIPGRGTRVLIPGEPEALCTAKRLVEGIPILPSVEEGLRRLAQELDVSWFDA